MSTSAGSRIMSLGEPFVPANEPRSLFLTFSNGFPLSEDQIFEFFDSWFPMCVEDVFVNRPVAARKLGKNDLFGKVIFRYFTIPNIVLGPYEKVGFSVYGRPMYCRRFETRRPKADNASAAHRDRRE
ncbi:PREDICTED: uncharacterized protein LOC104784839 [Camelina sativa]|uniref:Uncharacterized protein LOC104784839 n=1 Tax=Camelina sativa TaxID=90675 RepID=A0ABM0YZA6_CAMSA|nr:PREDICTED: uncharacterized protein LOC104784839 [Camelina sativa]